MQRHWKLSALCRDRNGVFVEIRNYFWHSIGQTSRKLGRQKYQKSNFVSEERFWNQEKDEEEPKTKAEICNVLKLFYMKHGKFYNCIIKHYWIQLSHGIKIYPDVSQSW